MPAIIYFWKCILYFNINYCAVSVALAFKGHMRTKNEINKQTKDELYIHQSLPSQFNLPISVQQQPKKKRTKYKFKMTNLTATRDARRSSNQYTRTHTHKLSHTLTQCLFIYSSRPINIEST